MLQVLLTGAPVTGGSLDKCVRRTPRLPLAQLPWWRCLIEILSRRFVAIRIVGWFLGVVVSIIVPFVEWHPCSLINVFSTTPA